MPLTVPCSRPHDPLRRRGRRHCIEQTTRHRQELRCGLTRLSGDAGHKVLPSLATSDQWAHYWGDTDIQRVGKFFEVSAIAFLGLWACYFTSFFLGVGTMSILGGVSTEYPSDWAFLGTSIVLRVLRVCFLISGTLELKCSHGFCLRCVQVHTNVLGAVMVMGLASRVFVLRSGGLGCCWRDVLTV